MNEIEYKKFCKRYDKFIKNNLPTPFWDEERQVREYVYFYNGKSLYNATKAKNQLEVYSKLSDALGEITYTGFYYPFTDCHMHWMKKNGRIIKKFVVEHTHTHSFEEVVIRLYNSPESYSISKDEQSYYSKQELEYLRRIQKYLLFIGMKDLKDENLNKNRFYNKIHSKYENAIIYQFSDFSLNKIINGEKDFRIKKWFPEYNGPKTYKPREYQALIVDKNDNFRMFIEFTNEEIKLYKDIKKLCYYNNNLKDDDKVIIMHFKILEQFEIKKDFKN